MLCVPASSLSRAKNVLHMRLQRRRLFEVPLYMLHHLVNTLVQHLLVNIYLARRPRPNPTPPLTLTLTLWGVRGRQRRSRCPAACFGGVKKNKRRQKGHPRPIRPWCCTSLLSSSCNLIRSAEFWGDMLFTLHDSAG